MTYIRCCYPFYLTKNHKFCLIFLILVFILLWIYPAVFDVLPNKIDRIQFLSFFRYLCQASIGLIISIIWIYSTYTQFNNEITNSNYNNNHIHNRNNDIRSAVSLSHNSHNNSHRSHSNNSFIHKSSVNTIQHSPVASLGAPIGVHSKTSNINQLTANDDAICGNNSYIFSRMNLPFANGNTSNTNGNHTIIVDSTRNLLGVANANRNDNNLSDNEDSVRECNINSSYNDPILKERLDSGLSLGYR